MWSILIPLAVLVIVILIQFYRIKEAFADATSTDPTFNTPKAIAIDKDGYLYVADTGNNTIRKITPTGDVLTLAGSPTGYGFNDGTGSGALFNTPTSVVVNDEGTLYVTDSENNCIRKVSPKGEVTTVAGLGGSSGAGYQDGTVTTQLRFKKPTGLCIDRQTKTMLFVVDNGNKKIRKLYLQQNGTYGSATIADDFTFSDPYAIVQDTTDGKLYVSDKGSNKIYILTSDAAGSKYTVTTLSDTTGDMVFTNPTGIYFDPANTTTSKKLYVCQTSDNTVIVITITKTAPDSTTYTTSKSILVGISGSSGTAKLNTTTNKIDGDGKVLEAKLNAPYGIVKSTRVSNKGVADLNTFFIADSGSHTIRKVYPTDYTNVSTSLELITVYGTGTSGYKDKQTTSTIAGTTTPTTTTTTTTTTPSTTTPTTTTTPSNAGNITLTLADLMALYGFSSSNTSSSTTSSSSTSSSTPTTTTDTTTVTGGATPTSAQTATDFYNQIKPSLLEDIRTTISKQLSGSPYASLGPMGSGYDGSSAACAQGNELNSSVKNVIDSNDYIRKDSIPCYGCSL